MGVPYAEVIGDPVAHSKSPAIHRFWLEKLAIEGDYRHSLVRPDELGAYFEARGRDENWRGCSVTMPHKVTVLRHVHKHRDPSFPIEPVNLVIPRKGRLEGLNTDVHGLVEPLLAHAIGQVGGKSGPAIVVGAGGVLYSVMSALSTLGFAPIWIVMRDREKAAQVARDYEGLCGRTISFDDPVPEARLLVNATPLGMAGFPDFPLGLDTLTPDGAVFDLTYHPLDTRLLKAARARGLRTIDGLAMLIGQAALSFQAFFGEPAPRAHDAELRERLTS